ncbi:hypothetical protein T492DRAFT_1142812 [Pavlovales sp. CCMP2436]|nr:hypothetical protein T492DRAFT_1142812 [Pavlovales sp. CCMP2436]
MRDDGTGDDGAPERDLRDRNTVSKKAQTAVHIAAMRKGGLSGYKLQEEDQVYSDEDDEQAEAREKRERDDDWLVGEDGSTYRDDGDDAGDYSDLDEDAPERRKAKGPVKKGAFNQLAPQRKAIKTVGGKAGKAPVFVSGARGGAGGAREGGAAPVLSARAADKAVMQSDMLDSILGDIGGSIGGFAAGSLHSGGILGSSVPAQTPGAARPVRSAREQLIAGKNVTGASRAPAPRQQRRPVALARPAVRSAFEGRLPPLGAEAEEEYAHEGGAEADWQGDDGAAEINDEGGGAGGDTDEVMDDAPAKSAAELAKPFSAQLESGAGGGEDWFTVTAEAPVDAEAEAPTPPLPAAGMSGGAPPLPPLEADGSMRFYFLDAYEDVRFLSCVQL